MPTTQVKILNLGGPNSKWQTFCRINNKKIYYVGVKVGPLPTSVRRHLFTGINCRRQGEFLSLSREFSQLRFVVFNLNKNISGISFNC